MKLLRRSTASPHTHIGGIPEGFKPEKHRLRHTSTLVRLACRRFGCCWWLHEQIVRRLQAQASPKHGSRKAERMFVGVTLGDLKKKRNLKPRTRRSEMAEVMRSRPLQMAEFRLRYARFETRDRQRPGAIIVEGPRRWRLSG